MKVKKRSIFILIIAGIFALMVGCSNEKESSLINKNNQGDETEKYHSDIENTLDEEQTIGEETVEEVISTVNLLATGDIMFHSPQFRVAFDSKTGEYDFSPVFKHVKKYIEQADISIANFETVTAGSDIAYSGFPRFNTPKGALKAISEAGFDILSTANNHSLDQGKKGLVKTIKSIEEYGMQNIGTYIEKERPALVEEVDGISLGFLSYTYGLNGMDSTLSTDQLAYMVNRIDEDKIKYDIEKMEKLDTDITIVYIHWGHEYHREPSENQIELGEKMIDWGADIILGSHPHVIQESEILNVDGQDKFIVYSMGNFLSNQRESSMGNSYTEDGIMINFQIEKSSLTEEAKISQIEYIPTWVNRYRENGKLNYEILPIEDALNGDLNIEIENKEKNRMQKSLSDTLGKTKEE